MAADTVKPGVTITSPRDPATNIASGISFVLSFDETLGDGLTSGEVTISGSAGSTLDSFSDDGGDVYTAIATDATIDGLVTVSIAAGVVADPAGNTNDAASFSITYGKVLLWLLSLLLYLYDL